MCFLVPKRGVSNCFNEGINLLQSVVEEQVRKVEGESISIQLRRCIKEPVNQRKGGNSAGISPKEVTSPPFFMLAFSASIARRS